MYNLINYKKKKNITEHLMDRSFCRKLGTRLVYPICLGHGSGRPPRPDHRDLLSARVRSSPQFLRRTFRPPSPFSSRSPRTGSGLLTHSFFICGRICSRYHVQALSRNDVFFYPLHTHTLVFFFAVHQSDRSHWPCSAG